MTYELTPKHDSRASFYGKAIVQEGDGANEQHLYSYGTHVATVQTTQAIVFGTHSATTLRHIKEFLLQHGFKADNKAQIKRDYMKAN